MDAKLLAWARAVKSRRRSGPPPLWLFTDRARSPDPLPAVAALPRGLAGIVFRHDDAPDRARLAQAVARLARVRHLAIVVAGDARLAARIGAGLHLREGRWPGPARPLLRAGTFVTSSAHGRAGLVRAANAGATFAFLSPAFATVSHPGVRPFGPVRWAALAGTSRLPTAALGGLSGLTIKRLGGGCQGAGAIAALGP